MDRRTYMRRMAWGAGALACGLTSPRCGRVKGGPNVLLIVADDLNDWVGCLAGHPGARTPRIDRLGEEGMVFEKAYSAAPLCNPSRTCLFTGLHPSTTGVYGNPQDFRGAMPDVLTIPQYFKANGYHTVGAGKVFHRDDPDSWSETVRAEGPDPRPARRPMNGITDAGQFDWGPVDADDESTREGGLALAVADLFGRDFRRPFFIAWGIGATHLPYYAPAKYFDMHPLEGVVLPRVMERDLEDVPPIGKTLADTGGGFWWSVPGGDHRAVIAHDQWQNAVQGYLACVSFTDHLVGRVLEALSESRYGSDTVVIFTSDQGTHLGEKRHWRKHTLWEESLRVPLLIVGPGIGRGMRCPRTVGLIDLYPTLAGLCDLEQRQDLEGRSLEALLSNPDGPWDRPVVSTYGKGNHSVRSERWRYIRYEDGTEELYDHEKDPDEWINLAYESEAGDIKTDMARWLPGTDADDAPHGVQERQYRSGNKWEFLG